MIVSNLYEGKSDNRRFTVLSDCDKETFIKILQFYSKLENKDIDPDLLEYKVKQKFNVIIKVVKQW